MRKSAAALEAIADFKRYYRSVWSVLFAADRRRLVVAAALICGVVLPLAAQQPPAGPAGPASTAGQAGNEVKNFPSSILWTKEVLAPPLTAPVAAGERLFIALKSGISARSMKDGAELWTAPIEVEGQMAAAGERLVVQSKEDLRALNVASGEVVWTDNPGRLTAPPYVHGEWLFVATGESLVAYRVADGTKLWSSDLGIIEERPASDGQKVYVPLSDGRLIALDAASGKSIWEFDIGIKPTEPLVYGDHVFVGSAGKTFCSVKVLKGDQEWCWPVGAAVKGAAVADGSRVYFAALDNLLRAHDRRHGALQWKQDLRYRPAAGPSLVGQTVSAPGPEASLKAFNTVTGKPAGELVLSDKILFVPLFVPAAENGETRLAALSGDLPNVWRLTLAGPPPYAPPTPPIGPLSVLPGQQIPVGGLIVPPE